MKRIKAELAAHLSAFLEDKIVKRLAAWAIWLGYRLLRCGGRHYFKGIPEWESIGEARYQRIGPRYERRGWR